MGEVWAVEHTITRRRAALKILGLALREKPEMRARFLREARAASSVEHPNVVEILDVFELEDGTPAIVMELLEGETLRAKLERDGPLSLPETARMLGPAASAVAAAHALGIVHRDLKPDNIFLSGTERPAHVKVLDFGIAKVDEGDDRTGLTATGSFLGTPHYMAPEQAFGEKDVDGRADIWALGVILYECVSGARPVEGDHAGQVLKQLARGVITPLEFVAPDVSADVARMVGRMLERERGERLADLDEVIHLLELHAAPGRTDPREIGTTSSEASDTAVDQPRAGFSNDATSADAPRPLALSVPAGTTPGLRPAWRLPRLRLAAALALVALAAVGASFWVRARSKKPPQNCGPLQATRPDGRCVDAGVPPEACRGMLEPDGAGGCKQRQPCPQGTMGSVVGCTAFTGCGPSHPALAAALPKGTRLIFVGPARASGRADGSEQRPWRTIQEAVLHSEPGSVIAFQAAVYREDLKLDRPVTLFGPCNAPDAAIEGVVEVSQNAGGSVLRNLGVKGQVRVLGAEGVVLQESSIVGRSDSAIDVSSSRDHRASATIVHTLVISGNLYGIRVRGAKVTITESHLIDGGSSINRGFTGARSGVRTRSVSAEPAGFFDRQSRRLGSDVTITGALLETAGETAVHVEGSRLAISGSVVQNSGSAGSSVAVIPGATNGGSATATVTRSQLDAKAAPALLVRDAEAKLDSSTVRAAGGATGSRAAIEVRTTLPRKDRQASATVASSLIEADAGLIASGRSTVFIESSILRGRSRAGAGAPPPSETSPSGLLATAIGDGRAQVKLRSTRVELFAHGLSVANADFDLDGASLDCNSVDHVGEGAFPKPTAHVECGCSGARRVCASIPAPVSPAPGIANQIKGVVLQPLGKLVPVEGATVRVIGRDDIRPALTAADGTFTLYGLPLAVPIAIAFEREGAWPHVRPLVLRSFGATMPAEWLFHVDATPSAVETVLQRRYPGARADPSLGVLDVHVDQDASHFRWLPYGAPAGVAGTKVEISPKPAFDTLYPLPTGPPPGIGPSRQAHRVRATRGTCCPEERRVTHPSRRSLPCREGRHQLRLASEGDTMRVPVYAGYGSVVAFFCPVAD